jgi:hypothetical protein
MFLPLEGSFPEKIFTLVAPLYCVSSSKVQKTEKNHFFI